MRTGRFRSTVLVTILAPTGGLPASAGDGGPGDYQAVPAHERALREGKATARNPGRNLRFHPWLAAADPSRESRSPRGVPRVSILRRPGR